MAVPRELVEQVLELPAEDRADLADRLLASLSPGNDDSSVDPDARAAWASAITERIHAIDAGSAVIHDGPAVIAAIRAQLRTSRP